MNLLFINDTRNRQFLSHNKMDEETGSNDGKDERQGLVFTVEMSDKRSTSMKKNEEFTVLENNARARAKPDFLYLSLEENRDESTVVAGQLSSYSAETPNFLSSSSLSLFSFFLCFSFPFLYLFLVLHIFLSEKNDSNSLSLFLSFPSISHITIATRHSVERRKNSFIFSNRENYCNRSRRGDGAFFHCSLAHYACELRRTPLNALCMLSILRGCFCRSLKQPPPPPPPPAFSFFLSTYYGFLRVSRKGAKVEERTRGTFSSQLAECRSESFLLQ